MNKEFIPYEHWTNPCYATSNLTIQSKPHSEFVYVSTSIPNGQPFYGGTYFPPQAMQNRASSVIVMISTHYQELPDKQKLELLSKLSEWTYNKTSEIINQNK